MDNEKQKLLAKYAKRNVNIFYQVDFWTGVEPGDCIMVPDREGDCLTAIKPSRELMDGSVVRVLIRQNTSQADAVRGLKKILQWVERDPDLVEVENFLPGQGIFNYVEPGEES